MFYVFNSNAILREVRETEAEAKAACGLSGWYYRTPFDAEEREREQIASINRLRAAYARRRLMHAYKLAARM